MYVMVFLQHYISCLNYYVIVAYICLQIYLSLLVNELLRVTCAVV